MMKCITRNRKKGCKDSKEKNNFKKDKHKYGLRSQQSQKKHQIQAMLIIKFKKIKVVSISIMLMIKEIILSLGLKMLENLVKIKIKRNLFLNIVILMELVLIQILLICFKDRL